MTDVRVAVTIVTFNSGRYIAQCLEHVCAQDYRELEIIVVDNDSADDTGTVLRGFEQRHGFRIFYNRENNGFAGGQNQAIAAAHHADWVLTLNPDVRLTPGFISALVRAGETSTEIGSVSGKLLAVTPEFEPFPKPLLDSTGIFFTPNLRHLDRGSRVPDRGQYDCPAYIIGGTGAACLYRATMIRDISVFGEFFDEDFFAYREDADVAWRAQLLGWKCLYTPEAVASHVRTVVPENRSSLAAVINMHSVKNRWLLRIKNTTPALYRRFWLPITVRDIVVVAACFLHEHSSLEAFSRTAKLWKRTWRKRREIMKRKRADDRYIASWFANQPVSYPADLTR